ncbi:VapE domain-containing protein [Cronbergia sp. UHCC 0137]|uniref:VapE domain-containing protein n=1 Tax=Cronbergia sp. UHCC 0137 TaxID=3110239 RepID=UPI002B20853E|nr:VapE domain-containing protein [Cronbergia sp. UHCC 0137]MEA5620521.1 VapE domain-containing protein [Cronbergia sp. UHCC 0137]
MKALQTNDITTLDGLSHQSDIPIEWLKPNVTRTSSNDGWKFHLFGEQPQVRYDNPKPGKDGKKLRYKTLSGTKADIGIPNHPDGLPASFLWDKNNPIVITEGFKKAIKACSADIPSVATTGVWNGLRKQPDGSRVICPTLQSLIDRGYCEYIIAFDADAATKPDVIKATLELAEALSISRCTVRIATGLWTTEQGKGMDDFITNNGVEAMRAILESAYTLELWEQEIATPILAKKSGSKSSDKKSHSSAIAELTEFYGDRIKRNLMTNEVEKDGEQYYLDSAFIHISEDTGIELSKSYAADYLVEIARRNSYHPVINYLESIKSSCESLTLNNTLDTIHKVLSEATTVQEKLHLTFLTKTLVAAVNRVYKPGCFQKNVCILYGQQNAGKSSFWRELASDNFFNSSYKGTSEKHDLMVLHSAWINEIPEFDKVYKKTDVADLKSIISTPADKLVLPYARTTSILKRMSIIVATTNRQDVLLDPTGGVRFWVVNIPGKINFEVLLKNRDLIWACAYNLYKLGYSYELSEDEQAASSINNETYSSIDPINVEVENACRVSDYSDELRSFVTLDYIWTTLNPGLDGKSLKRNEWQPITDALTRLGYMKKKKRIDGKLVSGWELQNKKVENLTVTPVTTPESHTGQVLPNCYQSVTNSQSSVTDLSSSDTEALPDYNTSNRNGNSSVTVGMQGLEPLVTGVTVKSQNFFETELSHDYDVKIGDTIELTDRINGLMPGDRYQVTSITPSGVTVEPTIQNGKRAGQSLGKKHISTMYFKLVS